MKPETEMAVRGVLMMDADIAKENIERALDVLRGKVGADDDLVHIIRFDDAMDLLKVSRRTLTYYLDKGHLDRVYGCGHRALGVSRESLLRFTSRRVVRRRDPQTNNLKASPPGKGPGRASKTPNERKHRR